MPRTRSKRNSPSRRSVSERAGPARPVDPIDDCLRIRQQLIDDFSHQTDYDADHVVSLSNRLLIRELATAFCEERGYPPVPFDDFNQALAMLAKVIPHITLPGGFTPQTLGLLFEQLATGPHQPAGDKNGRMKKSAERKRSGAYYTPPEFARHLVAATVTATIDDRFRQLESPRGPAYWHECLRVLKSLRVCDPACGTGAFLLPVYDTLKSHYEIVCREIARGNGNDPEYSAANIREWILTRNLYGVDLSSEAVECCRIGLWLHAASSGNASAELPPHIRHGNSLVNRQEVDPAALDWEMSFPEVFSEGGFDVIVGNPPWERLKLQEREFFSVFAPEIAAAHNAATRRKMIAELKSTSPELHAHYQTARERAEAILRDIRTSGRFPLTACGDLNAYMLFAELSRSLIRADGRVGLLVPSGIATDRTTRRFFEALVTERTLLELHDFENRRRIFPEVDGRFKFSLLVFGGKSVQTDAAEFSFFNHRIEDLQDKQRQVTLSPADFELMNPNTRTCPVFRFQRDAELTRRVYRRMPVLVDERRGETGNPWGIRFGTMFHQTKDAGLFITGGTLQQRGFQRDGNVWRKGEETFLPLYEGKMVQAFDHRAAGIVVERGNWFRQGQTATASAGEHADPDFAPLPRWWVSAEHVEAVLPSRDPALLCFKLITSPTNQRTMIAAMLPPVGAVNSLAYMQPGSHVHPRLTACLLANLNSFALDYIARQKIGNVNLNYYIVKQLPILPPAEYERPCPWSPGEPLRDWIASRSLALTCTSTDMQPLSDVAGYEPSVTSWDQTSRQQLRAELDATFFQLYGFSKSEVEYVLSTFRGDNSITTGVLSMFDRLSAAIASSSGRQECLPHC